MKGSSLVGVGGGGTDGQVGRLTASDKTIFLPALNVVSVRLDLVVVDAVEEQRQGLQVDQGRHDPVDAIDLVIVITDVTKKCSQRK